MPKNPLWNRMWGSGPYPGYLGGLVVDQPVLIREPNLVAFVTGIRAFPNGMLFTSTVEQALDDGLLVYVEHEPPQVIVGFADGSQWSYSGTASDALHQRSSSASRGEGGATWTAEYWLPALPGDGPVSFAIRVGEHEGRGSLPGNTIVEAASRAMDLWDE